MKTIVYFDAGCALCRREIAHYRRLDRGFQCDWRDIGSSVDELGARGVSLATAMARLHVIDDSGEMHTGAYAFAAIWSRLPYYRWMARILRGLHLLPLLDMAYGPFARWRFNRRCADGFCSAPDIQARR